MQEAWIDLTPIKKAKHIIKRKEQLRKVKANKEREENTKVVIIKKEDHAENKIRTHTTTNTTLKLNPNLNVSMSLKKLKFLLYHLKIRERKTQTKRNLRNKLQISIPKSIT